MDVLLYLACTILGCFVFSVLVLLRRYRDWERLALFALAGSLTAVLVLSCIGARSAGETGWNCLFTGIQVVFEVFEGDSGTFRGYHDVSPWVYGLLSCAVPLLTVFAALSLLWSHLPHHVPCGARVWYIFSNLDANSIRMAKSLSSADNVCIFLRTQRGKQDADMLRQLQDINHYLYPRDETRFLLWPWRRWRTLRFFFMSENTDENFNRMEDFLKNVKQKRLFIPIGKSDGFTFRHELYLLSETESAPMLIGHLRGMLRDQKKRLPVFRNTELWLLDRFRATSYDLLQKQPLHAHTHNGQLNVLILGFGRIGREFFRAACSMGVIPGCNTVFTLCDLDIRRKLNAFQCQCPELERSVRFWSRELDAETDQLDKLIRSGHFHYILVALGEDERNIRVASRLKRYYRKCHWAAMDVVQPRICVNIEDSVKQAYEKTLWAREFTWDHGIHVFGGLEEALTKDVLMPRNLWTAARWLHERLTPRRDDRIWTEYERRSSIACAAHIASYLKTVGNPNLIPRSALEKLIATEHLRWMAYVRSEGMQKAEPEWVRRYYPELGTHVDVDGQLSPCLVDAGEPLARVQELVDELRADKPRRMPFRDRDEYLLHLAGTIQSIVKTGKLPSED